MKTSAILRSRPSMSTATSSKPTTTRPSAKSTTSLTRSWSRAKAPTTSPGRGDPSAAGPRKAPTTWSTSHSWTQTFHKGATLRKAKRQVALTLAEATAIPRLSSQRHRARCLGTCKASYARKSSSRTKTRFPRLKCRCRRDAPASQRHPTTTRSHSASSPRTK
jgi:hypothetical protein